MEDMSVEEEMSNQQRHQQQKKNKKSGGGNRKPALGLPKRSKKANKARAPPSDNASQSISSSIEDEESITAQVSNHEHEMSLDDDDHHDFMRPHVEMPHVQEFNTCGLKPNDDERFTLDDTQVRHIIYTACRDSLNKESARKIGRIICINFTKQHFLPGATKWYHLRDHYYELLSSVLNSLAFATGKKVKLTPSDKVVNQEQGGGKRRRCDGDAAAATADPIATAASVAKTPEVELNNFLQGNKELSVYIETLVTGNKVSGFRWWIFDRYAEKTPNDTLSLGLRESLLEAAKIQEQANKQMQAIIKNNGSAKSAKAKKAAASKQYALSKEFSFSNYATFDRHFTGLVKRYFGYDSCLAVSGNVQTTGKAATRRLFRDTRPYADYNTVTQDGVNSDYTALDHPCNLSALFAKEQAMFYYVNAENINEAQCRLESYIKNASGGHLNRANESVHSKINLARNGFEKVDENANLVDVADYKASVNNNEFLGFPYESITYAVNNAFLSHEFIGRMPLPHRLGTTLYTQKDVVSLKRQAGLNVTAVEEAEAETEMVREEELNNFLTGLVFSEHSEDEEQNIFGLSNAKKTNTLSYGAVVRYMGIHQTEPELTTSILLAQQHHIDVAAQSYLNQSTVPRDILDKFVTNKRNELDARLKLILTNIGPKNRTVVTESLSAAISAQEDTRHKSLSSSQLLSSRASSDGRDQTSNIMDQIGHNNHIDEKDPNLLQLPYVSMTQAELFNNSVKTIQIQRKAAEYVRRRNAGTEEEDENGLALDPEARALQLIHIDNEYQSKLASGEVAFYKETIEKYRPFGNSLYTLKSQLHNTEVEEVFLGRDIFLRLAELNSVAYANLDLQFFDHETGQLPAEKEEAYYRARRELRDALAVECWHEFFENRSVSLACDGIRSDLLKQKVTYAPPSMLGEGRCSDEVSTQRKIGTTLPVHNSKQELRPYGEYRTWIQALYADQFGIAYNYKIMSVLYFGRYHHCRWHPDCNSPKHNIILSGTGMAGKSHMLQAIKKILPTGVGDMVTHITDQAFNVDRNMNDMLLIYEEFQNKFLGYSSGGGGKNGSDGGGGGGSSAGSDKDTTNFFKARLTSGATTTMSWFENEETGMRDMKISKAHCQGSIMGASNNNFTDADPNVMSRFILLSVPKSKAQHEGNRPQDKTKFQFGVDTTQDKAVYEQHSEIHRVYFMVEQMIKSNVLGENVFGVNVDGGRIMRDLILDHLQKRYGLTTGDVRKRDHILELARSMALSYAVWMGLTSPLTRYLQYDPHDPEKFIGFNPRVITEGILPFMVITKDMIFDAITSLSSLWYHDYQDLIIEVFATKLCKLQELRQSDFLVRSKNDNFFANMNARKRGGTTSLNSSMNNIPNSAFGNAYGAGGSMQDDMETDHNYIVLRGKDRDAMLQLLSVSLGDMVVSPNDINKFFVDHSKCQLENCDTYELVEQEETIDELTGATIPASRKLVRGALKKNQSRPIVEMGRCPQSGKQFIGLLIHFCKQKLPGIFTDELIQDLTKNQPRLFHFDDFFADEMNMDMDGVEKQPENQENEYEERVRRIGKINAHEETLIIKSIKDIMENAVLEDIGMDVDERTALEESYANPTTGQVPWLSYMTADPPKPILITDFYPELKENLLKTDDGDAPILFVDQLKMLDLKPRKTGKKFIIRNHNTVSPSTRVTLSIYKDRKKQLVKRTREDGTVVNELGPGEVLKKARIHEYGKTDSWELDQDIDSIFCEEHLRNIAFPGLKSKPNYELINYPPCTYMAIMEDKAQEEGLEGVLLEYPLACNLVRIAHRKKHAEGLINPASVTHKPLSRFMRSNLQHAAAGSKSIGKPVRGRCLATERQQREALIRELL